MNNAFGPIRLAATLACLVPLLWVPGAARGALRRLPVRHADPVVARAIYHERCLYVTGRVNETTDLLFLLDTGANVSALDRTAAETAGLQVGGTSRVEGTGGVVEVKTARVSSLSVGAARSGALTLTLQDLSASPAPSGARLGGILGYDFLRRYAVRIDYAAGTVSLALEPASSAYPEASRSVPLGFRLDNGIPRIRAVLNGAIRTELRIDTGASIFETPEVFVNVTERDWRRLQAADSSLRPYTHFGGMGTGGPVQLPVARIRSLRVAAVLVADPNIIVQPPFGYFAREDAVGFVSNNLLEKHSPVILDYPAKKLYLHRTM